MLDKSIPYKHIIMAIDARALARVAVSPLPEGFSFRLFTDGDEKHWARIETSVLEFPAEVDAEAYFARYFLPFADELKQRCVFVVNPDGLPVATATAWFEMESDPFGPRPILHWVSNCPEYQGRGLGRAVVTKALTLLADRGPDGDALLHTQTWSHPAIWLYHTLGFNLCRTRTTVQYSDPRGPRPHDNDFAEAVEVLRQVVDETRVEELIATAVE